MRQVSLLIKPASSLCNMRCAYCFYADETEHRSFKSLGVMTEETASRLIDAAFSAVDARGAVSFSFQGGEPTMAGLDFFRRFVALAEEKNQRKTPVAWAIQTNGLNLTEAWAEFLREKRFLVGLSVDGDRALHDAFRPDAKGEGTYGRVTDRLRLLQAHRVDTNLLCVVNGRTAKSPARVYRALKGLGTGYIQFIPCLDPLGVPRGSMKWSLTPEAYGQFLCGVFDEWYRDWAAGRYVSVRLFDDFVYSAMGLEPGTCSSCGRCGYYLVAEADGSLYPCDFYVLDEWKLGMPEEGLEALSQSETMRAFRARGERKPARCLTCPDYPICRGGCPRDWTQEDGRIENYYCPAFRHFFAYARERIYRIAQAERRLRQR